MQPLIPWIDVLGRSLLHFFWQGALIGLLYWLLRPLCATVAARYRLGMGALLLMLACPLLTLALMQPGANTLGGGSALAMATAAPAFSGVIEATAAQLASSWRWEQFLPWFVALWLAGVCLIATRSFLHWRRLARLMREATALPRDWQLQLIQLSQRFGILRPVRLLSSLQISTPTLIGWLKPAILLPASLLSGFTPAQIELIIAHELSHVRRFDYLANLAQVAIETLLFYHPAVHWISRDVRQARENCCDDLVLTLGGGNAVTYARTLADLEELQHDFGAAMPALGAAGGVLFARIRRIVDPRHALEVDAMPRGNGLTLPLLLALAGIALAALRLHVAPTSMAEVVMQAPRQNMALITGNAQFSEPRSAAPALIPPPAASMPQSLQSDQTRGNGEYAVERVARPQILLANPQLAVAKIANPRAPLALAPLHMVAPQEIDATLPVTAAPETASAANRAPLPDVVPQTASTGFPAVETLVQPHYPTQALTAGITGKVDLDFRIAADGSVRDIRVVHAQPSGMFEQAAIAALRQWHFSSGGSDNAARYTRSFAFTRADSQLETCREVTGSHICRRQVTENGVN
jgi:TonB family protein